MELDVQHPSGATCQDIFYKNSTPPKGKQGKVRESKGKRGKHA